MRVGVHCRVCERVGGRVGVHCRVCERVGGRVGVQRTVCRWVGVWVDIHRRVCRRGFSEGTTEVLDLLHLLDLSYPYSG